MDGFYGKTCSKFCWESRRLVVGEYYNYVSVENTPQSHRLQFLRPTAPDMAVGPIFKTQPDPLLN